MFRGTCASVRPRQPGRHAVDSSAPKEIECCTGVQLGEVFCRFVFRSFWVFIFASTPLDVLDLC